jgi:lipoyl(octanoyl) transferase
MISFLHLGTLDYATGLRLQQTLVDLRKGNRIGDVLLLLEHTPVITLGRNAKAANVIASPEQLAGRGVDVFECDRGGDVTFHGPGQLVGYPIFDLRAFPSMDGKRQTLGVIEYVRRLEEVLIRTCADFGIRTERVCGLTGVWTNRDPGSNHVGTAALGRSGESKTRLNATEPTEQPLGLEAKIAAIGIHVSRSITSHGFALNVNNDLEYFNLIIPCGITSKPVTSMKKELAKPISIPEVANSIVRNVGEVFQSEIIAAETLDALLSGAVGVPMKLPAELRKVRNQEETFWA